MKLTMVGTGYVGLVTGVCFANTGNDVVCLDIDERKIKMLNDGVCPIYEPGLTELMERNTASGRLTFTTDKDAAYKGAEMIFICVGTPSDDNGHCDLSYVMGVADDIARVIKSLGPGQRRKTIVVKSTVPVGTTHEIGRRIRDKVGPEIPFAVADNPEFLKEGDAISDFNKPDRVVCGVDDDETARLFMELYDPFVRNGHPVHILDVRSSEMVKYASNNFLATKISFINEMALLCEVYGADIEQVRKGMCADKRIGNQFLYPGLGYGGSCFPKDTLACIMMGDKAGRPALVSRAVHEVNQKQRELFFAKITSHYKDRGGLAGKSLAFWGLSFKPRTDDIREAPALTLIRRALGFGANTTGYDPVAGENAARDLGPGPRIVPNMYDAAKGADGLVISTDWDEFKGPDFARLKALMREPVVFDGRNLFRPDVMARHGFTYYSVGRATARPR